MEHGAGSHCAPRATLRLQQLRTQRARNFVHRDFACRKKLQPEISASFCSRSQLVAIDGNFDDALRIVRELATA